ncbi:MAG: TatD family hydrolase [bacterium]|nr:TatD family hydrolase [Myxococcales bacterium]MCB9541864.1 TatD family hydrolase [Myxococcales bacterium]
MQPLIDSHAHLTFDRYDADRAAVLDRATAAGVEAVITIGTDLASSRAALALAEGDDRLFASAGVHPHDADALADVDWPAFEALWRHPKVRAVGECGLDYYYDHSDRGRQREVFRRHLEAAGVVGLPVVIHIRDAFDDAYADIAAVGLPAGGVVHCFTGGPAECEQALAMGLFVSISGIVTFNNAKDLRAAVPLIPADRLLVETDSPFLAPVPHRGKRNEPANVVHTAREVAKLRGEDFAAVCATARANTIRLFKLPL